MFILHTVSVFKYLLFLSESRRLQLLWICKNILITVPVGYVLLYMHRRGVVYVTLKEYFKTVYMHFKGVFLKTSSSFPVMLFTDEIRGKPRS